MCDREEDFAVASLMVSRWIQQGAEYADAMMEMYKDKDWRRSRQIRMPQMLQYSMLGVMQANPMDNLPLQSGVFVRELYSLIEEEFGEDLASVFISSLDFFNSLEKWVEDISVFKSWGQNIALPVAIYNAALRAEEETSWAIIPTNKSGRFRSMDVYSRWRKPRYIHKAFVGHAFVVSVMKAASRAGNCCELPDGLERVVRWINHNLNEEYEPLGSEREVILIDLDHLMASLGSWMYGEANFKRWLSQMDPDDILIGTIRWLDNELIRFEEIRQKVLAEE